MSQVYTPKPNANRICRNAVMRSNSAVAKRVFSVGEVGKDMSELMLACRKLILQVWPDAVESLWIAPKRMIGVGQSPLFPKHFVCVTPNRKWVTLGFDTTTGLEHALLEGKGKTWRRVRLETMKELRELEKKGLSTLIEAAAKQLNLNETPRTKGEEEKQGKKKK